MSTRKDERFFDTRLLRHRLDAGILSRDEIRAHLEELPDDAEHAVPTETRFVSTAGADEDDD